jgi:hypothetical protein
VGKNRKREKKRTNLDIFEVNFGSTDDNTDQPIIVSAHTLHGRVKPLGKVGWPVLDALDHGFHRSFKVAFSGVMVV